MSKSNKKINFRAVAEKLSETELQEVRGGLGRCEGEMHLSCAPFPCPTQEPHCVEASPGTHLCTCV